MYYIGIDLGTSSVKLLLVDEAGTIHNTVSKEYPLSFPHEGWNEQNPEDWWKETVEGLKELIINIDPSEVKGIGCGGQMHGLVILDEKDEVIRPCILWNDGRTDKEVEYLNHEIGEERLSELTANIAFAGFTAPKILWLKKNEPDHFERIKKIMLPKDYINYKLTGRHVTDYSDASGMLLLDVKNKCWSKEMCSICDIDESLLPELHESYDVIGEVNHEALEMLKGVSVVAGAGDNAAAAIGTGTIGEGNCNISLGTSGTIFISSHHFQVDENNALHSFAHADGNYHLMACMLSAASCNKWFAEEILHTKDYAGEQEKIKDEQLGNNNIYFLPYLMGERSPINDTDARGCFVGMDMHNHRTDMYLSVLEGVAFAIRDSLEVAKKLGLHICSSKVCGGGAKSPLWLKIISNVLNIQLEIPISEEGPGYGGAMLAMVGCKAYESIEECCEKLIHTKSIIEPDVIIAKRYEEKYQKFRKIYPAMKDLFKEIREM
ncbi:MAG: xylulokinase [Solobacterium sp.]|nr:xylulokinase [Solobacterium sp.]